ncbi:MAG: hypothetical protein JOZ28_04605 [Candidatus Eremiobacteraeota bacterium]|nr:hypothetical protein [Candidatus Eremiobacteraeota bacterium]
MFGTLVAMTRLDRFLPAPQLRQIDHIDVGAPLDRTWLAVRHFDLARSPFVAALFALRTMPDRVRGRAATHEHLCLDDLTAPDSGFRILDEGPAWVTVGAIGKVWQPEISFVEVTADTYARFQDPGWVKVAWELRCETRGSGITRIIIEVRVAATDVESWKHFVGYFRVIGPFSHFIRRHMLSLIAKKLGRPAGWERVEPLPGDALIADAAGEATDGVTIAAQPEDIWPWLVQMGCGRAGWYSFDLLDNAGVPSAAAILPELQALHAGDIIPATPAGDAGFEVLLVDPPRALVLGGLYDMDGGSQRRFTDKRPERFWHVTWAFVLEPIDATHTRLHVRARAAFGPKGFNLQALTAPLIHHVMETAQLRNLRQRVETARVAL